MDELAKRFADLAAQYGPDVMRAALVSVRIEVYSTLVSSFIWLAFGIVCLLGMRWSWPQTPKDDLDLPWGKIGAIAGALVGAICIASFVWIWIDPWTWTALNHPELWLAKKALHI